MSAAPMAPALPAAPPGAASGTVVCLVDGLPGFPGCRHFVLVAADDLAPLVCLQGLEGGRPSFLAIDPRVVVDGYRPPLSAADRLRLGAADGDPLLWLALVHLEHDRVMANLLAPVVINPARMIGLQVIDTDLQYSTHHDLLKD